VHDYFEILGVPTNAAASEVRRACARRVRRAHPDFADRPPVAAAAPAGDDPASVDVAIDFLDMRTLVDRMLSAFFGPGL
jgi:hypothetical protein